jgi:hypothetical protein
VILSEDELWRVTVYCRLRSPPGVFRTGPCLSDISLARRADWNDGGGPSAGPSLPLQTLYANDAVKHPLAHSISLSKPVPEQDYDSDSDSDSDDEWEDNMDPITCLRFYAANSPVLAKVVQEYDQREHERLKQRISKWVEEVSL